MQRIQTLPEEVQKRYKDQPGIGDQLPYQQKLIMAFKKVCSRPGWGYLPP